MNPREKARLFHELGQLLRSGSPFPRALQTLAPHTRGRARAALDAMQAALDRGSPVAEALVAGTPLVGPLDAGVLTAGDRSGRIENGFAHLAEYHGALAEARSRMWSRMAYPVFLLHFALLALSLPLLFSPGGGIGAFLKSAGLGIGGLWAAFLVTGAIVKGALSLAEKNAATDRLLRAIPLLGKMRREFALSRFCSAYNLQLDAGVNVFSSLELAGASSASAVLRAATARAIPAVRAGEKVGPALAACGAFPQPFTRAFTVGEETGQLDQEMRRISEESRASALRTLDIVAEWIPRLIYVAILIAIAVRIVTLYQGQMRELEGILNQ